MYLAGLEDFPSAVKDRHAPCVTADNGVAVLELVEAIRTASATSVTVGR